MKGRTRTLLMPLLCAAATAGMAAAPGSAAAGSIFSISALVNDTGSGVREGFTKWGGGIGSSKDVSLFNMAQLMP